MSILGFEDGGPKKLIFKKSKIYFLGICGLIGALAVGSTLASNINLNNGNNVEFGQGVVVATSCDHTISIVPISTFVNNPTLGSGVYNPDSLNAIRAAAGIGSNRSIQGVNGIVEARVIFTGPSNSDRTSQAFILTSGVGNIISASSDGQGSISPINGVDYSNGASISTNVYQLGGTDSFTVTAASNLVGTQTLQLVKVDSTTGVPTVKGNFTIDWLPMPPQDSELTHVPYFALDSISISDIANNCQGKIFTLSGYNESSEESLFTPIRFRLNRTIRNSNTYTNGNWSDQIDVLDFYGGVLKEVYINTQSTGLATGELGTTSISIEGFETGEFWKIPADQLNRITLQTTE